MEILQGVWKQQERPRAVVEYGVKIFLPSPPNYVTRSPGESYNSKIDPMFGHSYLVSSSGAIQSNYGLIFRLPSNFAICWCCHISVDGVFSTGFSDEAHQTEADRTKMKCIKMRIKSEKNAEGVCAPFACWSISWTRCPPSIGRHIGQYYVEYRPIWRPIQCRWSIDQQVS